MRAAPKPLASCLLPLASCLLPPGLLCREPFGLGGRSAGNCVHRAKSAIVMVKQQVLEQSSTVGLRVFSTAEVQVGKTTRNTEPWGLAGEAIS
jgi:hypothetical protein